MGEDLAAHVTTLHPITHDKNKNISVFALPERWRDSSTVVKLSLDSSNAALWLCFEPAELFISKTEVNSPWYHFLEHLCSTADSSLARIRIQRIKRVAAELEIQAHHSNLQSLWLHELGNKAAEMTTTVQIALESFTHDGVEEGLESASRLSKTAADFARVTKQINRPLKIQDERQVFPLSDVVANVMEYHRVLLESREIATKIAVPEELRAAIDFTVAYLALSNLVSNAIKAIPRSQGGHIVIEASSENDRISCQVTNSGPGIEEASFDRIFQSGFTTHKEHSGFGLPASRDALRKAGGDLVLDTGYRDGARFLLYLPASTSTTSEEGS